LWAIVGLGNPGRRYARTRHNAGFMVLEELAVRHGVQFKEDTLKRHGRGSIEGANAIFAEPLTFMNLSGHAVRDIFRRSNATAETLIVIHDDKDLATGRVKVKQGGGSGGHNGIKSIVADIGTPEFFRVRVGIGNDPTMVSSDYVLSKFSRGELAIMKEAIQRAADAVETVIRDGLERAMNVYNTRE
jgi:PTH1 family peptidyl-tRNA hydrolase